MSSALVEITASAGALTLAAVLLRPAFSARKRIGAAAQHTDIFAAAAGAGAATEMPWLEPKHLVDEDWL